MTKEQALANLVVAIRQSDITSHESNRQEDIALRDAFKALGVSPGKFWEHITKGEKR